MKGLYRYIDENGSLRITRDTDNIPESATALVSFDPPPIPAPPHTPEDHELIASIRTEFAKVFERIHGYPPPENDNAANQQTG